jgi:hypothetical protein
MFIEDGGVLDRHIPTGEGDKPSPEGLMGGFQRRVFQIHIHGRRLAGIRGLSMRGDAP